MDFKELSPELMERARACKTSEELIDLANSEGMELSDEQIEAISGGHNRWTLCSSKCHDETCVMLD